MKRPELRIRRPPKKPVRFRPMPVPRAELRTLQSQRAFMIWMIGSFFILLTVSSVFVFRGLKVELVATYILLLVILYRSVTQVAHVFVWEASKDGLDRRISSKGGGYIESAHHPWRTIYQIEQTMEGLRIQFRNASVIELTTDVFEREEDEINLLELAEERGVRVIRLTP